MRTPSKIAVLFTVGALSAAAAAAPAGCFFPDYTFGQAAGGNGGGGSGPGPGGSSMSNGGSQGGMGGMTSSSTGIGGTPCGDDGRCVADVPDGWEGYFALFDGKPADDPGCPTSYPSTTTQPYIGQGDFSDGGDASCKCTCKSPTGEICNFPTEVDVQPGDCNSAVCGYILPLPAGWDGSCTGMEYVGGSTCSNTSTCMGSSSCSVSVTLGPAIVDESQASCQPNPVQLVKNDAGFASNARACGDPRPIPGGKCGGGQACLPAPPSPFSGICIMQTGDVSCPPLFTKKHVFFDTFKEERACMGACACPGHPTGGKCDVEVTLYKDRQIGVCTTKVPETATTPLKSGTCVDVDNNPDVAGRTGTKSDPTGGHCVADASGTTLNGSAEPEGPTTFCCIE